MSEEIEQVFLGTLMIYNHYYPRVSKFLRPSHFGNAKHAEIFDVIGSLIASGRIANPVTLKNELEEIGALDRVGGTQYLIRLACSGPRGARSSDDAEGYARAICGDQQTDWWTWYCEYLNTDEWRAKRRKVLDRCGGLCEGCRDDTVMEVHHLTYAHVGDELLYELVGLCKTCHDRAHNA